MSPEEKAKELIGRFVPHSKFNFGFGCSKEVETENAKACAIICCDEIIVEIEDLQQNCVMEFPMALEYWQKVKTYIQSL